MDAKAPASSPSPLLSPRLRGIEKTLIRRMNDLADPSCIDLGLGELRFPTPRAILDHVKENLDGWRLGYTPNEGYAELRALIAEKSPYPVTPDRICVTVGAQEAILAVLMVTVDRGDEVLVPDPGFPAYPSLVRLAGGEPKAYPLRAESGFRLKAEDVLSALTPRTKAVVLNSPHNPTGAVDGESELRALAHGLKDAPVLTISDEVYREISFGGPPASIAAVPGFGGRCAVIDSFSKSYCMTGWRIGWCAVPAELAKPLASFHQLAVTCVPAISQRAALHALKGAADEERRRNLDALRTRRDLAVRCLREFTDLEPLLPEGAFYIFVNVAAKRGRHGGSLELALDLLAKEKVVTIPGIAFGERGEGWLRLSFAAEPEAIEEGIRRIGRFLEG
jgi:aspartate/methionine/tyrosine aminotransferase